MHSEHGTDEWMFLPLRFVVCPDLQVGEMQHVLVTEESFDAQYYVAHNKFYEQVTFMLQCADE